ncbi:unnamed protein product, partial [Phaeothamnion confervicola]
IGESGGRALLPQEAADGLLVLVTLMTMLVGLWLGDAPAFAAAVVRQVLAAADARAVDVLLRSVRTRSYAMEGVHAGVALLSQWDDMLATLRWSALLGWPESRPPSLLGTADKLFHVRWAALRGLGIVRARTATTLTLLHDAFMHAELEPARWLMLSHAALLVTETVDRETPVFLGLMEAAATLLRLDSSGNGDGGDGDGAGGGLAAGITATELGLSGAFRLGGGGGGEAWGAAAAAAQRAAAVEANEWRAGRFMELFLSPELRAARPLRWNEHQYDRLAEHSAPALAQLAQHLAEAFDLGPPPNRVDVHCWTRYGPRVRAFLAEATCASRSAVHLGDRGLGDVGYGSFVAVAAKLRARAAAFPRVSPLEASYPLSVVTVDLSGNRLGPGAGLRLAEMLHANTTVRLLDLSGNGLDAAAASAVARAVRGNAVLLSLNLAGNRIGPKAASDLARMIRANSTLTRLDLSGNPMGEQRSAAATAAGAGGAAGVVPSAGPALGRALRHNTALTRLDLNRCRLGAETGAAFALAVRKHPKLTTLGLAENLLLPDGGSALVMALTARGVTLTALDASDNQLGRRVGRLLGPALRKNSSLRALEIGGNALGTRAGVSVARALRQNRTLASLGLSSSGLGPDACRSLAVALEENCSVTALDLSENALGASSAAGGDGRGVGLRLARALRRNVTLTGLELSANGFPPAEV